MDIVASSTDVFCPNFGSDFQIVTIFFTHVELPVTQPNVLKPVWIIMVLEGSIALKTVRIQMIKCLWKGRKEEVSQLECTNKIEPSERLVKHKKKHLSGEGATAHSTQAKTCCCCDQGKGRGFGFLITHP